MLLAVAQLDIAGQREILAERVSLKAVVGEDAAQVGVAVENDAKAVPHLALEPTGDGVQARQRRHRQHVVGVELDPDAPVLGQRQQVVIDVEAADPLGIIGSAKVHQLVEGELGIVAQPGDHIDDRVADNEYRDLTAMLGHAEDSRAEQRLDARANAVVGLGLRPVSRHRSKLPVRRIFRWRARIP